MLLEVNSSVLRTVFGLPLLVHIGYLAMTSLPVGTIPGRPADANERRNQDLRARVVAFLGEVRRAEEYAQRADVAGWPPSDVEEELRAARRRVMNAAAAVAKETGRRPTRVQGDGSAVGGTELASDVSFFRTLEQSIRATRRES